MVVFQEHILRIFCLVPCALVFPRQPVKSTWHKGSLPSMSLVSIAHHFLDRLTVPEFERLRAIATGLSGMTVPVGSTCSGLATTGLCVKALFQAINQRFNTNCQASCEFAVENSPPKQRFILGAHGDEIKHLFADVSCFEKDEAFCLKEGKSVKIPTVFLLVASPSCVNLSGQRSDRAEFASCYQDDSSASASGHTYQFGYRKATQRTEAEVTIYENVRDAAHSLKDSDGKTCTPAVDIIRDETRS